MAKGISSGNVASIPIPSGTVLPFAGATAPTGYLICDGSTVSREAYGDLFNAIGTAWGEGDGSTTFHLPDLRGVTLRGVDGTAGRDPDKNSRTAMATGGNSGNNVGSYQADQYGSHRHSAQVRGVETTTASVGSWFTSIGGANTNYGTAQTNYSGGNETRMKNAYVNYIIRI